MGRGYVVVEGHGETEAVLNLLNRLWQDLQLPFLTWAPPIRMHALHLEDKVRRACAIARAKGDVEVLLLLRDADLEDDCPKHRGPEMATWMNREQLPFPAAAVLLHKEYEVLFLPCLATMAGREWHDDRGRVRGGLKESASFAGDPESKRGIKEWLTGHMPSGRSYKPSLDQLPLTRMVDFDLLRQARLPCFGTFERALTYLSQHQGMAGAVYPPAAIEP